MLIVTERTIDFYIDLKEPLIDFLRPILPEGGTLVQKTSITCLWQTRNAVLEENWFLFMGSYFIDSTF